MNAKETHYSHRVGWLRATVLGANDGLVSTASLILGVVATGADAKAILASGLAGLVAGALSMAAGEYVSVSSQSDTEEADLKRERIELATMQDSELEELAAIYVGRGLDPDLAHRVAEQLTAHNALEAHARDELGIMDLNRARPVQAAFASAGAFAGGGLLPLLVLLISPRSILVASVLVSSLGALGVLGAVAARSGGASVRIGTLRVLFWGALAMGVTLGVGALFGIVA